MAVNGWIVVRPGRPKTYSTVLAGKETWTGRPQKAYLFAEARTAKRVAGRVGGRAEPVGGVVPPDNLRAMPRCEYSA